MRGYLAWFLVDCGSIIGLLGESICSFKQAINLLENIYINEYKIFIYAYKIFIYEYKLFINKYKIFIYAKPCNINKIR